MSGASFDSTKTALQDLLLRGQRGKLQLPDFQRPWVWDDDRVKGLLASITVSFPIGAVMLLETGGESVRFKPRPLEGAPEELRKVTPETLILDGQQRLTSLYQSLVSQNPVDTKDSKGKPIKRWYFLDMKKALLPETDRDDVVISVPEDKVLRGFAREIKLDLSPPGSEFKLDLFPVNKLFDSAEWRQAYSEHWNFDRDKMRLFNDFEREVIKRFEGYQLPVIELKKETPKEAVCLVFERVNTGGVALTVFELLTASFAAENFQLREDWDARRQRLHKFSVLHNLQNDDFLQVVSLLVTQARRRAALDSGVSADSAPGISCKRRDILKLEVDDWKRWADKVEAGLTEAARFLYEQKIFRHRDLPYRTQLVPLAAMFVDLEREGEPAGAREKIARWYWCGVLGELYGSAIESRFARDLPEVVDFVRGATAEPSTVAESNFQPERLLTLRTRNSAAYKGIYALLMRHDGLDFRTGKAIQEQTIFDDNVDIHHIYPEKWCRDTANLSPAVYNSVINKTAISASTNRKIGGKAPSDYLPLVEKQAGVTSDRMDEILRSHLIDPALLRKDRFWESFADRAELLLQRIEAATGKSIARNPKLFRAGTEPEVYDEGESDEDETAGVPNEKGVAQ